MTKHLRQSGIVAVILLAAGLGLSACSDKEDSASLGWGKRVVERVMASFAR